MHLSKLRLIGFKSFVEPTDFEIEPGLTGVIGPNGCGKSNLVEALRWVMGENSYKSMRASGMDDVIFSGAGDRPARNMAEVGLTLDNSARTAPPAFNDAEVLEVTRRIEREAGSTYRINGREVRARDVQILFADASTGARSPALVRQGQIAEIIAAKPQARRRILEEAAGVAGLHTRRHEAELRLKGAEDNLARIGDLLDQIQSQADGLRRQARQAHRYRELQSEIRRTQAFSILIDYEDAKREAAEAQERLAAATAAVVACTRAQGEAARHQAVAAHALPDLREREAEAGSALQKAVVARETLDGEERRAKGRLAELARRLHEMDADLARDFAALEDAGRAIVRLDAEEAELGAGDSSDDAEAVLRARLEAAQARRSRCEERLARAETERAEAQARRRVLDDRLRDESLRMSRFERDLEQARRAREDMKMSLDLGDGLDDAARRLHQAGAALGAADNSAKDTELALSAARDAERICQAPLLESDRQLQRLETEVKTLAKLLETANTAKWAPISDAIHVAKGCEMALGAALGDDLDASHDPAAPAYWLDVASHGDAALPNGVVPLLDFVEAPSALRRRLAQIGLVDRAKGPTLRVKLHPGQRLVSREGDIWRWDGFTQAAEAPTPAARRLVERNRLADLRAEVEHARTACVDRKTELDRAQTILAETTSADAAARSDVQAARRAVDAAQSTYSRLDRQKNEADAKLAALETTESSAEAAYAEAARNRIEYEAALAALPPGTDLDALIGTTRRETDDARAAETEVRAMLQSIAREREARTRRLASIASERDSWRQRCERVESHRADIEVRRTATGSEHDDLAGAPDRFILARRRILDEVAAAEAALRSANDMRAAAESALIDADRTARAALDAMANAREENARCEARCEAAGSRVDALIRAVGTELDVAPDALPSLAGVKPDQPRPPAAQVTARLDLLKADRERLGAVNLRADDELDTIEAQRAGLAQEKVDLSEAIRRLRQGISTLNKEGRERLLGAFGTVNEHFKELFTSLFGGGTAELQLVESDDPLEAGLEILARPPGKKPQVMTLLSGGEQALTAISLIFAVFLTNPSPICVLDEVDAPLDDANVERFCDLVDAMRRKTDTRFIAITHNPITMARMDRLFGVTQTEAGVSQLVSVDLAGAEEMLEAS